MSDQEDNIQREERQRNERLENARARMNEALTEYVQAAKDVAWLTGWKEGFYSGWDEAFKSLKEKVETERSRDRIRTSVTPSSAAPRRDAERSVRSSSYDTVLNYIQANPGRRGVEIATALAATLPERTVRTALHRLKGKKITIVEGHWYVTEAAPTPPPRLIGEE